MISQDQEWKKESYGNLLVCKIIKLYDDKEEFEWRYSEWVNNKTQEVTGYYDMKIIYQAMYMKVSVPGEMFPYVLLVRETPGQPLHPPLPIQVICHCSWLCNRNR